MVIGRSGVIYDRIRLGRLSLLNTDASIAHHVLAFRCDLRQLGQQLVDLVPRRQQI